MKYINHHSDWYCFLKKGDIVKCISNSGGYHTPERIINKRYTIIKDSDRKCIHYKEGLFASHNFTDFIPIKMKAFPELNMNNDYYEIY